jgi:CrcB protein
MGTPAGLGAPPAAACPSRRKMDRMMWSPVLVISFGAAAGALLRWQLGVKMNSLLTLLPLGTLTANLIGGYIIGVAVAYLAEAPNLAPEWRLFIITGFCGGLTTFSTFSAEVVARIQQGQLSWAFATIAAHLIGSLIMTFAGIATVQLLKT